MSSPPLLPGTSDERLLELVRDGEERAFEIVVMRYRASLVGYCMRLGLSDTRAEDAVQQCFLSALLALRRGDEVRDLRAWLGRIAHNVAVNMMRAGSANRETGTDWAVEDRAIHIPDMDGGLAAREALAEVAALPPMQREALLQSALGGRTYGEVAASMGVSEGAVRGLLHRARATLRNAAAIFSPFPLMKRASSWLGGGSPSAGRVLELSAPGGGSGLSTTAVRALGAGFTAVVVAAAGVAVAPHGGSPSGVGSSGAESTGRQSHVATVPQAAEGVFTPASGQGAPANGGGASSNPAPGGTPGTAGAGNEEGLAGNGESRAGSPRQSSSVTSPSRSESELPSSSSPSGPAQASSVPSQTPTSTPAAPPSEQAKEVNKPAGEAPATDDKSEAERARTTELEEEKREKEAEEAAEKAEAEAEQKHTDK